MTTRRFLLNGAFCLLLLFPIVSSGSSLTSESLAPKHRATSSSASHAWFIRPDGGDRTQCTGTVDAVYRGKGSKQPCAFKHPYYLFTNDVYNNKQWIVAGGDTVILRGGPYRMGYKGPNPKDMWGSCPGDAFNCLMPPLPSGTPDHPTRFLGENYEGCKKKTQLFGGFVLAAIINLRGSKNVDVECLEVTDHSQCIRGGSGYPASEACSNSTPLSDSAGTGIITDSQTSGILLKNLDIHGLTSRGIMGAIGGDITVDHMRLAFNGMAGWDFDDGQGAQSAPGATVRASYLTVEWNGCNEEYPIAHSIPASTCFDQESGGYGDGIGTPNTPLSFSCDHCTFRYNTQDGFDLLHMSGSLISVTNSTSYGNMGQQWKMGPMQRILFQNNVTVNNCRRMSAAMPGAPDGYRRYLSLFCRAAGDGISFVVNDSGSYVFQNNSFAGYGATSYDIECSGKCSKANIIYQNNLNIGYKDPVTGKLPAIFYTTGLPRNPFVAQDHNIYHNMRSCPFGWTEHCKDPKIANMPAWNGEASLDGLNFHLSATSPAREEGVVVPGLNTDHDGVSRSLGGQAGVGAFQYKP